MVIGMTMPCVCLVNYMYKHDLCQIKPDIQNIVIININKILGIRFTWSPSVGTVATSEDDVPQLRAVSMNS